MSKKCIGCGVELQYTNKDKKGYIPKEKYEDSSYCLRCFRLKNYNEYQHVDLGNINDIILNKVNSSKGLVFFLIDFLNINEETLNTFKLINNNKILVISKSDIIPMSIKDNKIINYIKNNYNIKEDIILSSSRKNINTKNIINIAKEYNVKNVYILGYTNSGKSTLINNILNNYRKDMIVTTSSIPNTTIDFLNIEIEGINIIDSPGFILSKTLYEEDNYELIRRVNPKKYIKPITYQVKDNNYINIENRIIFNSNINNSFTLYISNNLNIEKIYNISNIKKNEIDLKDNSDIVIKGIGFINIKKACKLSIYGDYIDLIEVRDSIFRGKDNE